MKKRHFAALSAVLCVLFLTAVFLALRESRRIPLAEPHREDFSPHISPAHMAALGGDPEIKKLWYLLSENWFLSPNLTDLSQAITTQPLYYVPKEQGYAICSIGADGKPTQGVIATFHPTGTLPPPSGLWGLTYAAIENNLSGVEYRDYIITYDPRRCTVIVWARCDDGDRFLTYPETSDFYGTEAGAVYTLPELKAAFTAAYAVNGGRMS